MSPHGEAPTVCLLCGQRNDIPGQERLQPTGGLKPARIWLAYTFGLFSHIGMPVLLVNVRSHDSTIVEVHARCARSFVQSENANHRTDHAVVGAVVARVWRLAPAVMCAVRLHHDLDVLGSVDIEPEVQTLMATGLDPEPDWNAHADAALAWLHASADDLNQCEDALEPLLEVD